MANKALFQVKNVPEEVIAKLKAYQEVHGLTMAGVIIKLASKL